MYRKESLKHSLLLVTLYVICFFARANEYSDVGMAITEIFDVDAHKGSSTALKTLQRHDGIIVTVTTQGVSEWDGVNWRFYPVPGNNDLQSAVMTADSAVWVASKNEVGVFNQHQDFNLNYSPLPALSSQIASSESIVDILAYPSGIAVLTSRHLYFWQEGELSKLAHPMREQVNGFILGSSLWFKADSGVLSEVSLEKVGPHLSITPSSFALPPNSRLSSLFKDIHGNLVAVTSDTGVYREVQKRLEKVAESKLFGENAQLTYGIQAKDGFFYFGSEEHGLFILNHQLQPLRRIVEAENLYIDNLLHLMEDFQGNIWLSGRPNVARMLPPHLVSRFQMRTAGNRARADHLLMYKDMPTIIGTGLYKVVSGDGFRVRTMIKNQLTRRELKRDMAIRHNEMLFATPTGISTKPVADDGPRAQQIIEARQARLFAVQPQSGELFFNSHDGLFHLNRTTEGWQAQQVAGTQDELESLVFADNGVAWSGTKNGELYRIENLSQGVSQAVVTKFDQQDGLGRRTVTPYLVNGAAVIATERGVLAYGEGEFSPFVPTFPDFSQQGNQLSVLHEDPFASSEAKRVWYATASDAGYMLMSNDGHSTKFQTIFNRLEQRKIQSFIATDDNTIWFVTPSGEMLRFNIALSDEPPPQAKLNIRQIQKLSDEGVVSDSRLSDGHTLQPEDNAIRINYALADNSTEKAIQYRTRLTGASNENWSAWSTETSRDFVGLAGAEYHFEVEARDPWSRVSRRDYNFTVIPPAYLSAWAKGSYIVSAVCLLGLVIWMIVKGYTRSLQRKNLALEQQVEQRTREVQAKIEELQQQQTLKDRFFANVSHEFRTPLTLTIGPLKSVIEQDKEKLPRGAKEQVEMALSNSQKMLALVGQVLDLNRLEAGSLPLRVSQYDITALMRNVMERFQPWARQHQQTIDGDGLSDPVMLWFDQDQIEKCLSNLVSNAIKYSGPQTRICLTVTKEAERTGIQVIDNGHGIAKASQQKVFERFYQDKMSEKVTEPGTGIGLAMVKEIIALHHGDVELKSERENGCEFTLWLKNSNTHFKPDALIEPVALSDTPIVTSPEPQQITPVNGRDKTTLLVVDDNQELLSFISSQLSESYHVLNASNGEEGFNLACEALPDLIISDVMMPVMDGFHMTKKLKALMLTKTIPVILLTAKATKRETVEGFEFGADDYLTKPFDTSELVMRVNAQIQARKVIRNSIRFEQSAEALNITSKAPFVHTVAQCVQENLSDPAFNVERLASIMNMSRDTLTRKCNKELGQSPLSYIKSVRMHHASILLQENKISVSEIAYSLGFESLAYFSRTFKKATGKSPTEYAA